MSSFYPTIAPCYESAHCRCCPRLRWLLQQHHDNDQRHPQKGIPKQYTAAVNTRVSNSFLVWEIFGQVTVGLTCDYLRQKFAIILTTAMIVIGGILATASHGATIDKCVPLLPRCIHLRTFLQYVLDDDYRSRHCRLWS